jgi:(p)ppGpp synthase/HD superfamily hydrolase
MVVDIEVEDAKHLNNIVTSLRGRRSVSTVERARS